MGIKAKWTYELVQRIDFWLKKNHEVDYYIMQALSERGCFREYLWKKQWPDNNSCPYYEDYTPSLVVLDEQKSENSLKRRHP